MVVVVGAMALLLLAAKHAAGGAVGRLPIVSAASLNVPVPGAHSCFFLVLGCVCVFGCGERRHTHHTQHTQKKHSPQAAPPAASAKLVPHLAQVVALAHVEQPGILQLVAGFLLVGSVCVCSSFSVCMFSMYVFFCSSHTSCQPNSCPSLFSLSADLTLRARRDYQQRCDQHCGRCAPGLGRAGRGCSRWCHRCALWNAHVRAFVSQRLPCSASWRARG